MYKMIFNFLLTVLVIFNTKNLIDCVNSFKFPEKNNFYKQNGEALKIFNFTDSYNKFQCITKEGIKAHCELVSKCLSAKEKDLSKYKPSICFWDNLEPVVCCEDKIFNEELKLNSNFTTSNQSFINTDENNLLKKTDFLSKINNLQIENKNKSSVIEKNSNFRKIKNNQKLSKNIESVKPNCGKRLNLNNLPSSRIVKGNQTKSTEFPWTVAIYVAQDFSSQTLLNQNLNISDQLKKKFSNGDKIKNFQQINRKSFLKKKVMNSIFNIQKATSFDKHLIRKKRFFFLPRRSSHYRTVSVRQEPNSYNPFLITNSAINSNIFSSNKLEVQKVKKNLRTNFFFSPTNELNKPKFIPINSNLINNFVSKDKDNLSSIDLTIEKTTSKPLDDLKIETENQFDFKNTGINLKQECGGSILNEYFILTAAHCVETKDPDNYNIGVGSNKLEELKIFSIKKIIIHPDYDSKQFYHDIALLELKKPLSFNDNIQPICLPNKDLLNFFNLNESYLGKNDNEFSDIELNFNLTKDIPKSSFYISGDQDSNLSNSAVVVGWGSTTYNGLNSNILNKAIVNLVKQQDCNETFIKLKSTSIPNGITKDLLCARGSSQKDLNDLFLDNLENSTPDACQNDSGGPMYTKLSFLNKNEQNFTYFNFNEDSDWQENWYQLGIVSFGYRCGMKDYPGVYTNVANYYNWISSIINKKKLSN